MILTEKWFCGFGGEKWFYGFGKKNWFHDSGRKWISGFWRKNVILWFWRNILFCTFTKNAIPWFWRKIDFVILEGKVGLQFWWEKCDFMISAKSFNLAEKYDSAISARKCDMWFWQENFILWFSETCDYVVLTEKGDFAIFAENDFAVLVRILFAVLVEKIWFHNLGEEKNSFLLFWHRFREFGREMWFLIFWRKI